MLRSHCMSWQCCGARFCLNLVLYFSLSISDWNCGTQRGRGAGLSFHYYRSADKSLARPGRKQARKKVRDARNFNKIETRAVIKFLFLHGKAPKEIHAILTETLACFLPDWAKDLSAPL
jgi:hypothetical protein